MSKLNWMTKVCICLFWSMAAVALPAQTLTTIHNFESIDGAWPSAALVQGTDGNLYGTTSNGGANAGGTIFKITPNGKLTTLYSFTGGKDGFEPLAPLVQGTDGNFYGTTVSGGVVNPSCSNYLDGCGTVFKISPSGALTTLHKFAGGADGDSPRAGLVQAANGNLYGTTEYGGTDTKSCLGTNCGTVFEITPSGTLTTLHIFNGADGGAPLAGLVQGTDGNLYGTTELGGINDDGTIFKITPGGILTTFHNFDGTDGYGPEAALVEGADGNFYGTTGDVGGTVFKITPSGTLTTLHGFAGYPTDGYGPEAALVPGSDGNFYGTTVYGGANRCSEFDLGCGTLFTITPGGTLTTLYSFDNKTTHGIEPIGGLAQSTDGNFYGTTNIGGPQNSPCDSGCGTVFSLSVGLKPFVETEPTSGTAGVTVKILGSNLTGATSVTFNETEAVFTVVSQTLITTTVPAGAATGTVKVVTPKGTGASNVPFRVLP